MTKSFADKMREKAENPALQFITQPEEEPQEKPKRTRSTKAKAETKTPPSSSRSSSKAHPARRALPQYDEETKSRRLQLLLTPSLYEAVRETAAGERMSVNEYINQVLRDATERK